MEAAPVAIPNNAVFKLGVGFFVIPPIPQLEVRDGGAKVSLELRRSDSSTSSGGTSLALLPLRFRIWLALGFRTRLGIFLIKLGRRE